MARDVFISHASEDASVAAQVCALLEKHGVRCWLAPRDVSAGAVWDESILDAIERSRLFLLILSSHANQSQFVKNEVNRAFAQSKPIVTFRLEDVVPGRSLELYLARHHWTDAFPPPLGARVENLASSLRSLLDSARLADSARPDRGNAGSATSTPAIGGQRQASRLSAPRRWVAQARALSQQRFVIGLGAFLLGAAATGLVVRNLRPETSHLSRSVARMEIAAPGERLLGADSTSSIIALSPDGTRLAAVVRRSGTTQLYLRQLDQLEFKGIPGTEGGTGPFFSPDGQWIGFFSETEGKIKKVSVAGGTPTTVCDSSLINGATWGPDGTIIFSHGTFGDFGLFRVSATGGTPEALTKPDPKSGETGHSWPAFLPDGKAVLFTVRHTGEAVDDSQIVLQSLETHERRVLIRGGTRPFYAPTGHLVYMRAGALMAVSFDPTSLQVRGDPVPVSEGMTVSSAGFFALSDAGSLAYVLGDATLGQTVRLVWVDRKGVGTPLPAPPGVYQFPSLSPDAQRIALQSAADKTDIWVYDIGRDSMSRLTSGGNNSWPIWTPDGKRITFTSNVGGHQNIFWELADGSGAKERLTTSEHVQTARSWSADGNLLVFSDLDPATGEDIWFLPVQAGDERVPKPFLRTPFSEGWARLSPDGRWLAYVSKELVRPEVYVQQFPTPGGRSQISTDGGTEPVWSRNGKELFYRSGNRMMAVDIVTQPAFHAAKPRELFESAAYLRVSTTPNYDVSPDGQRFLMIEEGEQPSSGPQINLVLNWFEELKQKVPMGNK